MLENEKYKQKNTLKKQQKKIDRYLYKSTFITFII